MLNPGATEFKPTFTKAPPTDNLPNGTKQPSASTSANESHSKAHRPNKPRKHKPSTPSTQEGDHSKTSRRKPSSKPKAAPAQKKPARRPSSLECQHEPTTSFITIDQPIDPIHVIPGALANTVVHAYDSYVAWIERCLQAYDVVTLVGMAPTISDVLSLVTIVQAKGIGSYHELATFSMDEGGQHPISGVQLKLHRI